MACRLVEESPEDAKALHLLGSLFAKSEQYGLAYNLFLRSTQVAPKNASAWSNVGMSLSGMQRYIEARQHFNRAHSLDPKNGNICANIALTYLEEADRHKALEWAMKALKLDPNHKGAYTTIAFVQLGLGNWEAGWDNYQATLGGKYRKIVTYADEPLWDGACGKRLIVYGEQGLGDEIMFASCLPDAIKDSMRVTVDCDERLQGLFRRSFPDADVYGTRRAKEITWDAKADAVVPIGQLPMYYRPTPESCPGKPFLKPDPERVLQWKALFATYKKPVIGICWSGGTPHNHMKRRHLGVEAFQPLFDAVDAVYVSLQYKGDEKHPKVLEFPRATRTPDYDDTAGLVAALDHVVGVHTAVHHLAGAMGVPQTILVPAKCSWAYALDNMPWYNAPLVRQKNGEEWKQTIERWLRSDPDLRRLRS